MDVYRCENCVISAPRADVPTGRVCRLTGMAVKHEDYCPQHTTTQYKCDCCGNEYPGKPAVLIMKEEDGEQVFDMGICLGCQSKLHTCATCEFCMDCSFETDPSPLEKIVTQQIQQGNVTTVTQVMNPERVAITCQKNCPCWSENFSCSKQNYGTCPQYQLVHV